MIAKVEKDKLKMIETIAEVALSQSPVLFDGNRSLPMQPLSDQMRPGKGKSEQGEQFFKAFIMNEMTGFEIEPPSFERGKERFNLPPLRVEREGIFRVGITGDDEIIASELDAHERESMSVKPNALRQDLDLANGQGTEIASGATGSALRADSRVMPDADIKGQAEGLEVSKPRFSDKFSVGNHSTNLIGLNQSKKALQKQVPFRVVGVARFTQKLPNDGEGNASMSHAQHQDIDMHLSQLPVAAVNTDHQVLLLWQERQHQMPEAVGINAEVSEETLDATIIGVGFGVGIQRERQLAEAYRTYLDERQDTGGGEADPSFVPGKLSLQHFEKSISLVHKAGSILGSVFSTSVNQVLS